MKFGIKNSSHIILIASLSLGAVTSLMGCSSELGNREASAESRPQQKSIKHTHVANECIDAVTHSHPNGKKEHLHYFHRCETKAVNPYAHSHPSASSITGYVRHVHPNGDKPHTHGK